MLEIFIYQNGFPTCFTSFETFPNEGDTTTPQIYFLHANFNSTLCNQFNSLHVAGITHFPVPCMCCWGKHLSPGVEKSVPWYNVAICVSWAQHATPLPWRKDRYEEPYGYVLYWPAGSKQAKIATMQGSTDALPVSVIKSIPGTYEFLKLSKDNTV